MQYLPNIRFTKTLGAASLGVGMLMVTAGASAQTAYSTNFESGYTYNQNLSDQAGWTTNDDGTGATYNGADIGNSDSVGFVNSFSTTPADHVALLGGAFAPSVAVPGSGTVYLSHGFNASGATALAFNTDYGVTASGGSFPARDSFGFTFRSAGNTGTNTPVNAFSINFVPSGNSAFDNLTYTAGGVTSTATTSFQLGFRFHLTVNVNVTAGTFSASIYAETTAGAQMGSVVPIATNVAYAGTIADIAATWNLANNLTTAPTTIQPANGGTIAAGGDNIAFTAPGSNVMLFDNFVVTVPEPSTYALLGLGAFGLFAVRRASRSRLA